MRPAPAAIDDRTVGCFGPCTLVDGYVVSEGVVRGAIQVPPSGAPVIFMADHPVTGGYPVVAVLVSDDSDRAAQSVPGEHIRIALPE
jgi:allophanate hydrolase subunit 2